MQIAGIAHFFNLFCIFGCKLRTPPGSVHELHTYERPREGTYGNPIPFHDIENSNSNGISLSFSFSGIAFASILSLSLAH